MAAAAAKTVKPATAKPAGGANTTADIPVADWRAADLVIKSILIGESGVGKSCLLKRFASGNYLSDFYTTIGVDLEIKTFECDGKTVKLQIWDTAGQERFRTITTTYYRGAHAIMLVFDVTNAATFAAIPQWLKQVEHYAMDDSVVMLVGNKVDDVAHRTVSKEDAEKLASTLGMTYIETSAKTAHNVEDAFMAMTRAYVSRRFDKRITSTPPGGLGRRRVPDDAVSVTDANGDAACAPSWKCPGMCTIM